LEHIVFSQRLLERFRNPQYTGRLAPPALEVRVMNPACGDTLVLSARVEQGRILEAKFQTRGCTASIAASDALAEWLTGRTVAEAAAMRARTIEEALEGLAPESRHAAVLAEDAARALAAASGGVRS
jgi:nitrogen fixation protein NifU and related proteins